MVTIGRGAVTVSDRVEITHLSHSFLIAMPVLDGSYFERKVVYMVDHGPEGALGIVINHAIKDVSLDVLVDKKKLKLSADRMVSLSDQTLYQGGPVQVERGFVLHEGVRRWESTISHKEANISLTTSSDLLEKIFTGECWERFLIALGFSGWGSGQLEQEIAEGAWWVVPAFNGLIFDVPHEQRWSIASEQIGISPDALARTHGSA